ncbi:MAG: aminotransferase-like domain-containing protein [Archangium sp.]
MTARPGLLSLGLGLPAVELFPQAAMAEVSARVLASEPRALQYSPALPALRTQVVKLMERRGVRCSEQQVFLTTGAQQGMSLLARLLLEPGRSVVVEDRAYSGFVQVLEPFQVRKLTVGTDPQSGMDVEALAALLERGERPSLIYALSDGHNPLGVSMSLATRQRLVELARRYRVPIIEDDAYGLLCYEKQSLPALRSLEPDWVFYVGSFSKILAPGLRQGWVVVPEALIAPLSVLKEASDIDTTTLSQRLVLGFLEGGYLEGHLQRLLGEYRARRDALLEALETHFPSEARWTRPTSGMFVWVELPSGVDTLALLRRAVEEEQMAFLPGAAFAVEGGRSASHCLRLNFSHCGPEQLRDAVARLGRILRRM